MKQIFSESFFKKIGLLTVVSILFLIFVGGLVRITGSGMGCPDWPKCFGYYIPPTDISQLTFVPNNKYSKGQMILQNNKLWVAQNTFVSSAQFDAAQWTVYTKHNYVHYNVVHTYIEWVNRMISVFVGIFMMLTVVSSFQYWKKQKSIALLSIASFLLTLFQAWIGAKVVESNLEGIKISIHMLLALAVVGLVMLAVFKNHTAQGLERFKNLTLLKIGVLAVIAITLLQIFYGTQVREAYSTWQKNHVGNGSLAWVNAIDGVLSLHKSLSVFVMGAMLIMYYVINQRLEKTNPVSRYSSWALALALSQIALGSANVFFNMPAISQLLHITLAGLLIASQFYVAILLFNFKEVVE